MAKKLTLSKQAIVDSHKDFCAAHAVEKNAVAAKRAKNKERELKKLATKVKKDNLEENGEV